MAGKVIALANLKGGVGKTTLAVNLAGALAGSGATVTLMDADLQGSASAWLKSGGLQVGNEYTPLPESEPAAPWLAHMKRKAQGVDFLLVDLPPSVGVATAASLLLCDLAIIPVGASIIDIRAAAQVIDLLHQARKQRDSGPAAIVVPNRIDRRTAAGREAEAALHELGEPVSAPVGLRSAYVDAATSGTWVGEYAPRSAAHDEIQHLLATVRAILKRANRDAN